ncbi:unnamed protein product [Peronospora belbahrii]|uniref:PX domain-containing protein n=1 Tax=Peronospora belbahrii TaxID=622444 RepID=A0ABN8DAI1_9STRA|nr:unnamed protein product [Peronospora belbahrii]
MGCSQSKTTTTDQIVERVSADTPVVEDQACVVVLAPEVAIEPTLASSEELVTVLEGEATHLAESTTEHVEDVVVEERTELVKETFVLETDALVKDVAETPVSVVAEVVKSEAMVFEQEVGAHNLESLDEEIALMAKNEKTAPTSEALVDVLPPMSETVVQISPAKAGVMVEDSTLKPEDAVDDTTLKSEAAVDDTTPKSKDAVDDTTLKSEAAVEGTTLKSETAVQDTTLKSEAVDEDTTLKSGAAVQDTTLKSEAADEDTTLKSEAVVGVLSSKSESLVEERTHKSEAAVEVTTFKPEGVVEETTFKSETAVDCLVDKEDEAKSEVVAVASVSEVKPTESTLTFKAENVTFNDEGVAFYNFGGSDSRNPANDVHISKRYSDFKTLHAQLNGNKDEVADFPSLPTASFLQGRKNKKMLEDRKIQFTALLNYIATHPLALQSDAFKAFLA